LRPLQAIERHAHRSSRFVRALLNFSRSRPAQRRPALLGDLRRAAVELSRDEAASRRVQLSA